MDGKLVANHKAKLADEEFFINLRTAAGRDGKRYFAAFAPGEQRFHLFDEKFKHLLSYPADALENRHTGLTTSNWATWRATACSRPTSALAARSA